MRTNQNKQAAWALGIVVLVALLVPALTYLWAGRLPDPMAIHWGADGQPDGFTPVAVFGWVGLAVVLTMPAFLLGFGVVSRTVRDIAPVAIGVAVMLGTLQLGILWSQLDLASSAAVRVGPWLVGGLLLGVASGLLWWWSWKPRGPHPRVNGELPDGAAVVDLPEGARIAWTGTTSVSRAVMVLTLLPGVLLGIWGLWVVLTGDVWLGVFLLITTAGLCLVAGSMRSQVTVDRRGVEVRSLVRWAHVPLGQVEHAHTRHVHPLGDFGGYGLRRGFDGSLGFVTSVGEALVVERAGEGPLVVTVDHPEQAAAALNTLVARPPGPQE